MTLEQAVAIIRCGQIYAFDLIGPEKYKMTEEDKQIWDEAEIILANNYEKKMQDPEFREAEEQRKRESDELVNKCKIEGKQAIEAVRKDKLEKE